MATQESGPVTEQEVKPIAAIINIAENVHAKGESAKAEDKVAEQPAPKSEVPGSIEKRRQENEEKHAKLAQRYALDCIIRARKHHEEEEKAL